MSGESGAEATEANEATELALQSARGDTAAAEPETASPDTVVTAELEPASSVAVMAQEPFESEEEERFFSEPPDLYEETTTPSFEHEATRIERTARPDAVTVTRLALPSELHPLPEPSPEDLRLYARRQQLRGRVAGILSAMLVVLLVGFVVRKRSEAARLAGETVTPIARAVPATVPSALPSSPIATVRTEPVVEIPPPPIASSQEDSSDPPSEEDVATLIRSARTLLGAGRVREGVTLARQAVEKNPLDAESYVLLAAGLQDLGQWREAHEVFAECRQKTKRGPSSTCQYFARR